MNRLLAIFLLLTAFALGVAGRKLPATPKLKRVATENVSAPNTPDTIAARPGAISLSGYEKTNPSMKETFFATSAFGADTTVTAIELTLTYCDMSGRMLHRRTEIVRCLLPPGETRALELPTWDRNRAFHYFRSEPPKRRRSTPFKVESRVERVVIGGS